MTLHAPPGQVLSSLRKSPTKEGPSSALPGDICGHGPEAGPSSIQLLGVKPAGLSLVPTRHTPQTRGPTQGGPGRGG